MPKSTVKQGISEDSPPKIGGYGSSPSKNLGGGMGFQGFSVFSNLKEVPETHSRTLLATLGGPKGPKLTLVAGKCFRKPFSGPEVKEFVCPLQGPKAPKSGKEGLTVCILGAL